MPPDRQPTLHGERLTFRPLTPADHDALLAVAGAALTDERVVEGTVEPVVYEVRGPR